MSDEIKVSDRVKLCATGWFEDEDATARLAVDIQRTVNEENQALRDAVKNFLGILDTPLGRMKFQSQFVKDVIEQAKKL